MKKVKVSFLWCGSFQDSVLFSILKSLINVELVNIEKADLLIFGPQSEFSFNRKILNLVKRKTSIEKLFPNIDLFLLKRKFKPIKLFVSYESNVHSSIKYDFSITPSLGIANKNHFRYAHWKDTIDWKSQGYPRSEKNGFPSRFGGFCEIDDLIKPLGKEFINKKREACIITSHLNEPRDSLFLNLEKHIKVNGYGPAFDKKLKDHHNKKFFKKDILKNYAFNLCPENSLYPGYYTEKIPEAFSCNCLPLTWADQNIDIDFNKRSFVNLLDYIQDDLNHIGELLKDDNFLKKFSEEPLCLKAPNLENEIKFISKVVSNL